MWQRFTENARKSVFCAQEEAGRLGQNAVGPEHLLLSLLHGYGEADGSSRQEPNMAAVLLEQLGIDLAALYAETKAACPQGDGRLKQDMMLAPAAKRVIDLAYDEAKQLKHSYIGTEHLLLGLIREMGSSEAAVLSRFGATLQAVRERLLVLHSERQADKDAEKLLSLDQAVKFLGTSKPTLYRLLGQDEIKGLKVGRQWRFRKADLVAYMERGRAAPAAPSEDIDQELAFFAERLGQSPDLTGNSNAKTARLVHQMAALAIASKASDIHLEPTPDFLLLRLRVGGVLQETRRLPPSLKEPLIAQLKDWTGMNPDETRLPQDGRIVFPHGGAKYDLRVSLLPSVSGDAATLRIFDRGRVPVGLENLGLAPEDLATLRGLLSAGRGLLVVTGPGRVGKTTLLYSCLQEVTGMEARTLTVEDPVESVLAHTTQVAVSEKSGLTAAAALRAFRGQDPDTILVGSLDDPEAALLTADAARAGCRVLCGLEAGDAVSALVQLGALGLEPPLLTATVKAVIAVRLCRRLCDHCKAPADLTEETVAALTAAFTAGAAQSGEAPSSNVRFFEKRGCDYCRGQGYLGYLGLYEVLPMTEPVAEAVLQSRPAEELTEIAVAGGMQTLPVDGFRKAAAGLTTLEEALAPPPG